MTAKTYRPLRHCMGWPSSWQIPSADAASTPTSICPSFACTFTCQVKHDTDGLGPWRAAIVQPSGCVEEVILGSELDSDRTIPGDEGARGKEQSHPAVGLLLRRGGRQQPPRQDGVEDTRIPIRTKVTAVHLHVNIEAIRRAPGNRRRGQGLASVVGLAALARRLQIQLCRPTSARCTRQSGQGVARPFRLHT